MRLTECKTAQARVWGSANWQAIAEAELSHVHDSLVERLAPTPGERWLDLATGTGAVALRAARAGAEVSALAPELIATARRLAAEEGLSVRFDIGDAERLGYADASFDVCVLCARRRVRGGPFRSRTRAWPCVPARAAGWGYLLVAEPRARGAAGAFRLATTPRRGFTTTGRAAST
jgi:SAM-dependent methyltransferase